MYPIIVWYKKMATDGGGGFAVAVAVAVVAAAGE
jgi:hypothetical protein